MQVVDINKKNDIPNIKKSQDIAISMFNFLLTAKPNNKVSVIDLYNQWSYDTEAQIDDYKTSEWALEFLANAKSIDRQLIQEALEIDNQHGY